MKVFSMLHPNLSKMYYTRRILLSFWTIYKGLVKIELSSLIQFQIYNYIASTMKEYPNTIIIFRTMLR